MKFLSVQILFKATEGEGKAIKGGKLALGAFLVERIMGECQRDGENR